MSDGYEYDIFLSYRRSDFAREWVHTHLIRELRGWLAESMPYDPRVFIDEEIDVGSAWPMALERALQRSKCMISVWNAPYFRSKWCLAEWETMLARAEHLRNAGVSDNPKLVYPLRFQDGDHFPPRARNTQWRDMVPFADPRPAYRSTEGYRGFMDAVKNMVADIIPMLEAAPPWDPSWPVVRPEDVGSLSITQPRLA